MGHEVVDIAEEQKQKKEEIKNIADELTSELTVARENLLEARQSMEKCNTASLAMLKKRKADAINIMDKVIKDVTNQINVSNEEVDKEVDSIDDDLKLVCSTKERAAKSKISEGFAAADVELERLQQIKDRVKKYILQEKTFQYYENDAAKPEKMVVNLSDTRNANSSQIKDEVRLTGTEITSSNSSVKRDEVTLTGTVSSGAGSSDKMNEAMQTGAISIVARRHDKKDEAKSTGRGSTSSISNEKRDEVLPIGTASTSSFSNNKRDEAKSTGTGSTSSSSSDKRNETRSIGKGSTTSNANDKRHEARPTGAISFSSSSIDNRDEVKPIGIERTGSNSKNEVTLSDSESSRTGISSYFAPFAAAYGNDIILAGTESSGLDSNDTHRDEAVGFQETGLLGSNDDDTYDDCVVVPGTSDTNDDDLFVQPPAKKICAQEGGIDKSTSAKTIAMNFTVIVVDFQLTFGSFNFGN